MRGPHLSSRRSNDRLIANPAVAINSDQRLEGFVIGTDHAL
jgi:hypothetical protein